MQLKSFTASTMPDAMRAIRREMGRDAIIVASRPVDGGIRVTAAIEPDDDAVNGRTPGPDAAGTTTLEGVLARTGAPRRVIERLVERAAAGPVAAPREALTAALSAEFAFRPLAEPPCARPLLLVGPPGSGKSVALAKLAARAHLAGRPVRLIAANPNQAGAIERLRALGAALGLEIDAAPARDALKERLAAAQAGQLVLVDGPAVNPFDDADLARFTALTDGLEIEPVLVAPAGGDAEEALELGETFAALGTERLIASKLDATRRFGALLATAQGGRLALAEAGASPFVGDGLIPLTAAGLAGLIWRDPARLRTNSPLEADAP